MYLWSTAMTSGISFVLLCVYVCLVRPMRRERRSIFQAYTASSAALLGNEFFSIKKLVKLNFTFFSNFLYAYYAKNWNCRTHKKLSKGHQGGAWGRECFSVLTKISVAIFFGNWRNLLDSQIEGKILHCKILPNQIKIL